MWGSLGEFEFKILRSPKSLTRRISKRYARHEKLIQKNSLQYTGENEQEITLEIKLLYPDMQILESLYRTKEPQPLFIGNKFIGYFVIEQIEERYKLTTPNGKVVSLELSLTLRESHVEDNT
ncbi:MAG: hypothetical protein DSY42_06950 [Aquifex sp.]|nr:MAG: hypothetical protein DSY42_06950 [Aquifex sp.]